MLLLWVFLTTGPAAPCGPAATALPPEPQLLKTPESQARYHNTHTFEGALHTDYTSSVNSHCRGLWSQATVHTHQGSTERNITIVNIHSSDSMLNGDSPSAEVSWNPWFHFTSQHNVPYLQDTLAGDINKCERRQRQMNPLHSGSKYREEEEKILKERKERQPFTAPA